jgi:hypothetical protein
MRPIGDIRGRQIAAAKQALRGRKWGWRFSTPAERDPVMPKDGRRIGVEFKARMRRMGGFHDRPIGQHPMWSYELAFLAANFTHVVDWLTLHHGALDVFVCPSIRTPATSCAVIVTRAVFRPRARAQPA